MTSLSKFMEISCCLIHSPSQSNKNVRRNVKQKRKCQNKEVKKDAHKPLRITSNTNENWSEGWERWGSGMMKERNFFFKIINFR